jgi:outer membrane lipoprotein-sorting protein
MYVCNDLSECRRYTWKDVLGKNMRLAGYTVLSALLSVPVLAQTPLSAGDILKKVENTYTSLTQWDFEATITSTLEPGGQFTRPVRAAGKGSSLRRMEMGDVNSGKILIVADGKSVWAYQAKPNQYTRKAQVQEPDEMLSYFEAFILEYRLAAADESDARLLREESIEIGNTKADCYVVQFQSPRLPRFVSTWWVDKRRFLVLRDDQEGGSDPSMVGSRTIWIRTQLDGVPDDLFLFTPPPGAKEQTAP